jgi:hypothetical protein
MMDLCSAKGVAAIFRVIPDPLKDIGFTILSHLHYSPEVIVTTYDNLADAIHGLTTENLPDSVLLLGREADVAG